VDEDRAKRLEELIESFVKDNKWDDREIQEALIIVARNHIWKQGLIARIKFWANLIGAIGVIGGLLLMLTNLLGVEVTKP